MAFLNVQAVAKCYGSVRALAGVTFQAEQGDIIALLGPSGCGKTTLLNLIAGFFAPDAGEMRLNDRDLNGVPPHRRDMAMVFQNYALFPHLSVAQNVSFGLEAKGVARRDRRPRIQEALAAVRLPDFGSRFPAALSGGQQQRVALARALVLRPSLILMDEPLSNLDTLLRKEMREELRGILKAYGITAVLVTHDQEEALAVADRVLLMNGGRIEQSGSPAEIYEHPRTIFGARFMETTNFIPARVAGRENGTLILDTPIGIVRAAGSELEVGTTVIISVRPERIRVVEQNTERGNNFGQNRVVGRLQQATYLGTLNRLHVAVGEQALIAHVPIAAHPRVGDTLQLSWYDCETLVFAESDSTNELDTSL